MSTRRAQKASREPKSTKPKARASIRARIITNADLAAAFMDAQATASAEVFESFTRVAFATVMRMVLHKGASRVKRALKDVLALTPDLFCTHGAACFGVLSAYQTSKKQSSAGSVANDDETVDTQESQTTDAQ